MLRDFGDKERAHLEAEGYEVFVTSSEPKGLRQTSHSLHYIAKKGQRFPIPQQTFLNVLECYDHWKQELELKACG